MSQPKPAPAGKTLYMHKAVTLSLAAILLCGCSSQQLYASGRNAQRAECMKLADMSARDRCLKDADMSHDTYKKEVDAARQ